MRLDVADRVRAKMEELKSRFPDGIDYTIAYDTTPFIRESVSDVVKTLLVAVLLVAAVVLVFLQNWRSVIIPLIAVPVAIVSTFAVMAALGFSLNNISLFGLVLAIGIVVDDAIVVVENVERWMEHGLDPREATRRAMDEVTGPIIAVALVLCAVFVPCAFVGGITGQFFRQFAVTIAVSTVFSAISSLTLSPALAAILLKPRGGRRDPLTWLLDLVLGWFFKLFNFLFGVGTSAYAWVDWADDADERCGAGDLWSVDGTDVLHVFQRAGRLCAAARSRPTDLQHSIARFGVAAAHAGGGEAGRRNCRENAGRCAHRGNLWACRLCCRPPAPTTASMFIVLKPFAERQGLPDTAIMANLRRQWAKQIKDAQVTVYGASPVPGLGVAGGFQGDDRRSRRFGAAGAADTKPTTWSENFKKKCRGWWA